MAARIIYLLIIILAVLWSPWWFPVIFGLAGLVRYRNFYEVVVPALLFDFLYSASGATLVGFPLMFSVLGIAAVYVLEDFKSRIMVSRL